MEGRIRKEKKLKGKKRKKMGKKGIGKEGEKKYVHIIKENIVGRNARQEKKKKKGGREMETRRI